MKRNLIPVTLSCLTWAVLIAAVPVHAQQAKKWSFEFTPYAFLAGLDGDITVGGNEAQVELEFADLLENIDFAAAARARVGYDRWFGALDVNFVGLGGSSDSVEVDYDQWIVEPTVGYQIRDGFEVFAGARYVSLEAELRFSGPAGTQRSGTQDWWDPIIGAAARVPLGEKFSLDLRGDVGGFGVGSELSLQGEAMANWHISSHVALQAGYRALYNDYEDSSAGFADDVLMHGPQVGLRLSF